MSLPSAPKGSEPGAALSDALSLGTAELPPSLGGSCPADPRFHPAPAHGLPGGLGPVVPPRTWVGRAGSAGARWGFLRLLHLPSPRLSLLVPYQGSSRLQPFPIFLPPDPSASLFFPSACAGASSLPSSPPALLLLPRWSRATNSGASLAPAPPDVPRGQRRGTGHPRPELQDLRKEPPPSPSSPGSRGPRPSCPPQRRCVTFSGVQGRHQCWSYRESPQGFPVESGQRWDYPGLAPRPLRHQGCAVGPMGGTVPTRQGCPTLV